MVRQGPDPRRVIDLKTMSPEDAEEILGALQDTIRWCEEMERQGAGEDPQTED